MGQYAKAIPFYERAVELDPRFAIAFARMATCYNFLKQYESARAASSKAYEYRDRASEREKLYVSWNYYGAVTGEIDKAADALEVWKRTYPRDWEPHNLLAVRYTLTWPIRQSCRRGERSHALEPERGQGARKPRDRVHWSQPV
jgi:tetratricopeptide (TPR) repeat protein